MRNDGGNVFLTHIQVPAYLQTWEERREMTIFLVICKYKIASRDTTALLCRLLLSLVSKSWSFIIIIFLGIIESLMSCKKMADPPMFSDPVLASAKQCVPRNMNCNLHDQK